MVARQRLDQPGAITGIARRLRSAESRASLGFSSITRGGMRVESAEGIRVNTVPGGLPGLRVTGLQIVDGTIRITGRLEGGGTFVWTGTLTNNGPLVQNGTWNLNGVGKIAGNADLTGILSVNDGGRIIVQGAGGDVVIDSSYSAPRILFGGANITAGPDSLSFTTGGGVGTAMYLLDGTLRLPGIPAKTSLDGLSWVAVDALGKLWKVAPGVGGPGRSLRWPFPSSTVTDEFGPRPSPGPGGSTDHQGIDFAPGEGTAIPAAGSGTVELAGDNGGFGYCVIINHGGGLKTLYGHMQSMPSVSVGATVTSGQIIGLVGNTGTSFGAHLHFEVHVNDVPVNPRTKLPIS